MALIVADIQVSEYKEGSKSMWQAHVTYRGASIRVVSKVSARDAARLALRHIDDSGKSRIDG